LYSNDWVLPRPADSTIFKALPEGGVLFSTSSEVYFGVNMVGARIWELLPPATTTFGELCGTLFAEYSDVSTDTIRGDAHRFLDQLLKNGLVIHVASDGSSADAAGA
jgi:Coenzyme PQQ synthesis protein D (PqqD)